jgi:hemoglobin/transferrin/lactoferrin receptor protein
LNFIVKKILTFSIPLLLAINARAQQAAADSISREESIPETVISATGVALAKTAVAQQVKVLNRKEIEYVNAQSTADLLSSTGQVFVQKSQQGGGSPVLRGFEASRVLLVVDGIRMNNAIYRAGHLQNAITLDNAALERVEVLFGPASTMYGSDALGGAICFFTRKPAFSESRGGAKFSGNAWLRYGSVNQEKTGHLDFNLGGRKLASFTSFTFSDFDDLKMGKNATFSESFGRREKYVARINGKDSLLVNPNPYLQKFSGYRQYDLLEKIAFQPSEQVAHTLNFQYSNSSNIPRYDRLTDTGPSGLAFSEWNYGPQERLLTAYHLKVSNLGFFNQFGLTASWQKIEESRHNRSFGSSNRTSRVERVNVAGFLAEFIKNQETQTWRLGIDGQFNTVHSSAQRLNISTGEISAQSTRYPDGGSEFWNAAVFATHNWKPGSHSLWSFSEGLRAGVSGLSAVFENKDFYPFPFEKVKQNTPTYSGNFGAVWNGVRHWRLAINASSGFRVPNVDDLAKVFDSQPGSVVVPNPELKPEKTLNLDLNLSHNFAGKLQWENVFWYTAFRDAIVTDLFQFNGQDSIDFDGIKSRVLASQNARNARIYGFSSSLEAKASAKTTLYGSVTYTRGQIIASESQASKPLDHIPPFYGKIGARWHKKQTSIDFFALFNGDKKLKDYNTEGEDNLQYAPEDGMPGWLTLNCRASHTFSRFFKIQAGIDNLLDTQYRNFASGINAPGRNFWASLRFTF